MKRLTTLFFWGCFFMTACLKAQSVDSLLGVYDAKVPIEKLHIHFDNNLYLPGQTVWYKAYLLKGNELSVVSKNLYLDWFDENGKLISQSIVPVVASTASGSFTVPEKYTGNSVRVMGYTKWMLNFDSAFLFNHTLAVAQVGAFQNTTAEKESVTTLQFFPEGGDLVENIPSTIAFKSLNAAGMPVKVNGIINNSHRETIARFSTEHEGMGKFVFTPLPNELYTAEWNDPQGRNRQSILPKAKRVGLVLSVNTDASVKTFSIERNPVSEERFKKVTIAATMNQQVLFKAKANLTDKTKIKASLPNNIFSSGILRLTIFDANMQPVTERVLFINNEEFTAMAAITTDTLNLAKRGKNVYRLELNDTIPASLSIAVTDGEGLYDSSENIISHFLLSAEIKGHVHNPAYYFSSDADSVSTHLDLVMLTNGWRKFAWEDVLTGRRPVLKYDKDTGYLSIAGKIDKISEARIKKAEMMNLILMAKDSSRQYIFTPLLPDGSFREENLILFDTTKVYYQLNHAFIPNGSHVAIKNTFLSFDSTRTIQALGKYLEDTTGMARIKAIAEEQKRVDALMRQTTLKEVIVKAKIKSQIQAMNEKYTSGLFDRMDGHNFNILDDQFTISYASVFAYLQNRVGGLDIDGVYSGNPSASRRQKPVALYLNESPIRASDLATINMANVAYIKVFDPPFIGAGGGGAGGAIAVYLNKGGDSKFISLGLDFTSMPGYTPAKTFYAPNYAEQQINYTQTDLRRTLYWNPYLLTDAVNRKIIFSFYNNDISHSLQIVLEGITEEGRLIHLSKLLK